MVMHVCHCRKCTSGLGISWTALDPKKKCSRRCMCGCALNKSIFFRGIHALPKRWNTCMELNGDYIEKWSHCVPSVFNKLRDKNYLIFKVLIWITYVNSASVSGVGRLASRWDPLEWFYRHIDERDAEFHNPLIDCQFRESCNAYSRINPTKSPASGAGNISQPRRTSQEGRVRVVVCA
jgi:hypothetical protein